MQSETEAHVEIDPSQLSKQAYEALVDEFILREGTDYGHGELSLEDKRQRLLKQIARGDIKIVYSLKFESCTLMSRQELKKLHSISLDPSDSL